MEGINLWLTVIVSVVTIFSALSGGLIFIWRTSGNLNNVLSNLDNGIARLNEHLLRVDAKADKSDERLDQHETRITILEKWKDGEL